MHFLTYIECKNWKHDRAIPDKSKPILTIYLSEKSSRLWDFAQLVSRSLLFRKPCLLWINEWEIWESNWHLYYRLRQSYGNRQIINEAPGHLFLDYEAEDLSSFLYLALLYGWDASLLTEARDMHAFCSHDEFVDVWVEGENLNALTEFKATLDAAQFKTILST